MSTCAAPVVTMNHLDAYLDHGFLSIAGWLSRPAVDVTLAIGELQRATGVVGAIAEIGVWQGRYLTLLSHLARPEEVVLGVDPFVHVADRAAQIASLHRNIECFAAHPQHVRILERGSEKLSPADLVSAAGGPLRFVSIDGDHTMPGCLHDLRLVAPTIVPRGVVAVDDIGNLSCPGVIEATIRYGLQSDATLAPFAVVANKLFMTQREHCGWYRDALFSEARAGRLGEAGTTMANYDAAMRHLGIPVVLLGEPILTGA